MISILVPLCFVIVYAFMTGADTGKRFGWFAAFLMSINWMITEIQLYKLMH